MAGYLIAEEGPLAETIIRLEEGNEWVLGRDPDEVGIVLEDPMVSRKHVICRLTPEGYTLENLSSVNPATQNGKVITDAVLLKEGDILQIGSTFFRFSEKEPSSLQPKVTEEISTPAPFHFEETEDLSSVHVEKPSDMRWLLKVVSGPNAGAEFSMVKGSTYILGKDPGLCDIVFQDLSVSRQHARLSLGEDNLVYIEDLNSRNAVLVNGQLVSGKTQLASQDLVALGTTSFLVIDREEIHETIVSPPQIVLPKEEPQMMGASDEMVEEKKNWKELIIPIRHLLVAGIFAIALIAAFAALMALFKTQTVEVAAGHETFTVEQSLKGFEDVQFSFNQATGKLFLVGHVLTPVEKQELMYKIKGMPFVMSVDDNVVVDEYVWQNMNALLMTNPQWQGISIHAPKPGKFVLKGYLQTLESAEALTDYMNINFPYLDRLDNQVVVETNLESQIQSMLTEKGFNGVNFQLSNGELVFTGMVDQQQTSSFTGMVEHLKSLNGVRVVKNFVVFTTANTSRIDVSRQYQVTGFSKKDSKNAFVVINGKILGLGDQIDGMEITNILPNVVLLEKDGLKYRINYNLQ